MRLVPFDQGIVFRFVDDTTNKQFITKTGGGLVLSQDTQQADLARWGEVVAVGPKVTECAPGGFVLIEHGMWTISFEVDGQRLWKTDQTKVLAVAAEPYPTC